MGMPAQHKIHPGFCLCGKIVGLMIQHDHISVFIQVFCQFLHRKAVPHAPVSPADQIDLIRDLYGLILQHRHIVFLQLFFQILITEIPVIEIPSVVISVDKKDTVCRLHLPHGFTAFDHILPGRTIIDIISGDHYQIRVDLLDGLHMLCIAVPVKGGSRVGIRNLDDPQLIHSEIFCRCDPIVCLNHMMGQIPADAQINSCGKKSQDSLPVYASLFSSRHTVHDKPQKLRQKPDDQQMDHCNDSHDRLHKAPYRHRCHGNGGYDHRKPRFPS